jgi:hypothetical protein
MAGNCGVDLSDSGQKSVAGSCEHGNEQLEPVKGGKFLDYLTEISSSQRGLCSVLLCCCQ